MKMSERSYSGKLFRPKPEIQVEDDLSLCMVAIPWGPRSAAKKVTQAIQDFFLSSRNDQEVTSPFQTMTCLSPLANNLRASLMLANDVIYREENKDEYVAGVELFACAKLGNELVWTQIGHPHVLLDRAGLPLIPLNVSMDLSLEHVKDGQAAAPLPQDLLGLEPTSNFHVRSLRPQKGDRLVLISRTFLPASLYNLPRDLRNLDGLSKELSRSDSESPFWIGILPLF